MDEPWQSLWRNWTGEMLTAMASGRARMRLRDNLRRTHSPNGMIRLLSSAKDKRVGNTMPRFGHCQRPALQTRWFT